MNKSSKSVHKQLQQLAVAFLAKHRRDRLHFMFDTCLPHGTDSINLNRTSWGFSEVAVSSAHH